MNPICVGVGAALALAVVVFFAICAVLSEYDQIADETPNDNRLP